MSDHKVESSTPNTTKALTPQLHSGANEIHVSGSGRGHLPNARNVNWLVAKILPMFSKLEDSWGKGPLRQASSILSVLSGCGCMLFLPTGQESHLISHP